MGTPALSAETERRVALLFAPANQETVRAVLRDECGHNLPCLPTDETGMDRILFAVLKLSEGDPKKLRDAVRLAKTDWRDLLVAAGFADDIHAHKSWFPPRSH